MLSVVTADSAEELSALIDTDYAAWTAEDNGDGGTDRCGRQIAVSGLDGLQAHRLALASPGRPERSHRLKS